MSPSIGLFSRRKTSADKAIRAALSPQAADPYIHSTSSSSAVDTLQQFAPLPQPPHSAPLQVCKKKSLPKQPQPQPQPQPIVSGYASESAGLVYAPRLNRSRTATFDGPPPSTQANACNRSKTSLARSSSSGPSRRTKSFDQRPQMEPYQEMPPPPPPPLETRPPAVPRKMSPVPPNSPMPVHHTGTSRGRVPLPATVSTQGQGQQGFYSPVSSISIYPVSPPLSPESAEGSPAVEYKATGSMGSTGSKSDMARDIAELKKAINLRDNVIAKYAANFDIDQVLAAPPVKSETQRVNEIISRRVHELNIPSRETENVMLQQSNRPKDHPRTSSPEDLEKIQKLKRKEFELVDAVKGKERELEFLRSNSNGYREQITIMEQVLAQKDEELENARIRIHELSYNRNRNTPTMEGLSEMNLADIGRRLMEEIRRREKAEKKLAEALVKSRSDLEAVLTEEEKKREEIRAVVWQEFEQTLHNEERKRDEMQQKSKDNLNFVLAEEEKRRAELNWLFGEKIENIESLRRNDQDEFYKNLASLKEENARLERQLTENAEESERNRQSVRTQRDANEELLDMTKKINIRLGEEKKKNRQLEERIGQINEDALNNVTDANREVVMLKGTIEEKDTRIQFFETELTGLRKEKSGIEEAWSNLESELEDARKSLLDRDERVKSLEEENSGVSARAEAYREELDELKKQIGTGDQRTKAPELQEMVRSMESMKEDIELYKQDVREYKKDVKKRDNLIKDLKRSVFELESLLEGKKTEAKSLQDALDALRSGRNDSPASNNSSGIDSKSTSPLPDEVAMLRAKMQMYEKEYRTLYEEHEVLKKKHDMFSSQQGLIIADMDRQLIRARKEKEVVEASALKQLKRMQQGFLQLSQTAVAGQLAGVGGPAVVKKYQEVPLPPLPTGSKDGSRSPKRSNTGMRRSGSKAKAGRRHSSLSGLSPTIAQGAREAVPRMELREKAKLDKVISVVHEPDGALGNEEEEEVIEW